MELETGREWVVGGGFRDGEGGGERGLNGEGGEKRRLGGKGESGRKGGGS